MRMQRSNAISTQFSFVKWSNNKKLQMETTKDSNLETQREKQEQKHEKSNEQQYE